MIFTNFTKFAAVAAFSLFFVTTAYGVPMGEPAETATTLTGGQTDEEEDYEEDEDYEESLEYGWPYRGYTVADKLNVRSEPDGKAPVLFQLEQYSDLSVDCSKDGRIFAPEGWARINYIDDQGGHEGYAAAQYLRVMDVNPPARSFYDHIDRDLVVPDGSPLFGMLSIERNGDSLTGTMWIKSRELQESGGNGILMWVNFKGGFYYGDVPVFGAMGPDDEAVYGDMLRQGVAYDSGNDIMSFGGMLWK